MISESSVLVLVEVLQVLVGALVVLVVQLHKELVDADRSEDHLRVTHDVLLISVGRHFQL